MSRKESEMTLTGILIRVRSVACMWHGGRHTASHSWLPAPWPCALQARSAFTCHGPADLLGFHVYKWQSLSNVDPMTVWNNAPSPYTCIVLPRSQKYTFIRKRILVHGSEVRVGVSGLFSFCFITSASTLAVSGLPSCVQIPRE